MADEQRLLAGRYLVGDLIGRGGMANVYRGTDTKLGRTVAIKILKADLATDPAFRTRFRQEAQAASRMAHPTIVRVFDAGEETVKSDDGRVTREPFIVMEYVHGETLKTVIAEGPIEASRAVTIAEGILTALEYSHRAGVVHRDIKPGNVMITTEGNVKVMDFGIARAVSDSSSTVAQTTAILGTASYFSPEQAKGETVDARTDLYSTGVVLFEMLTGRAPFRGDTAVAVAYQHVSETAVKPSSVNSKVSPALDSVVMRALKKDRYERYQTAAEFRDDVELAGSGKIPVHRDNDEVATALFGPSPTAASSTEQALRQLTSDDSVTRTQRRPPVVWIWAGIASVAVVMIAVMIWVLSLGSAQPLPAASRAVPDLAGVSEQSAVDTLSELDLVASVVNEISPDVAQGTVIRTDPGEGSKVPPKTVVRVVVSTGAPTVAVPDVSNKSTEQAQTDLTGAGLSVGAINRENSPDKAAGTVISTDPVAATEVAEGTTVNLLVSSGLVTIQDVRGQSLNVATDLLEDPTVGLSVLPKPDPACVTEPGNPVTNQSLAPGDVPQQSEIELTYCTG
ncbi:Stk1 family PASTA domain-containing Ser/Thr kinase [Mycetocola zhadangensis]|uniref:non-specific serine/threonine protein kinase n=1 Tax=Mycetocola zhadangensis TaxID=1164595 RepID=A0A3L7J1B7_9MICO|nr:Stk1 family PASTA domain-containing Ser/Thr kinase [Mycetocola zhadangensis]RLQ84035.1 Stk1 family PASTA domain-containing Ser/Thr kinase [Mycetocola zhadangensis]GGE96742.1 serine/threonine protein kinase [Mycetocola zhadangensis]